MNHRLHDDWEDLFEQLPVDTTARASENPFVCRPVDVRPSSR